MYILQLVYVYTKCKNILMSYICKNIIYIYTYQTLQNPSFSRI